MLPVNLRVPGPHTCATLLFYRPSIQALVKRETHDMIKKTWASYFFFNHLSQYLLISGYDNTCHNTKLPVMEIHCHVWTYSILHYVVTKCSTSLSNQNIFPVLHYVWWQLLIPLRGRPRDQLCWKCYHVMTPSYSWLSRHMFHMKHMFSKIELFKDTAFSINYHWNDHMYIRSIIPVDLVHSPYFLGYASTSW